MKEIVSVIVTAIMGLFGFGLIFSVMMLFRNGKVYKTKIKVLDQIYKLDEQDIWNDKPYLWRLEEFDSISYEEMLLKFWKPLDSFYAGKKCLMPTETIESMD